MSLRMGCPADHGCARGCAAPVGATPMTGSAVGGVKREGGAAAADAVREHGQDRERLRVERLQAATDVRRTWSRRSGATQTAGEALQVDVAAAGEPGEDGRGRQGNDGDTRVTAVSHDRPPHLRPRSRGSALAEIVADPAGLSPGAPHCVGGLPVSKPGLDADTRCRSRSYGASSSYVNGGSGPPRWDRPEGPLRLDLDVRVNF